MAKRCLLFIIFICLSSKVIAQSFSISGVVKDTKETLPGATILVANTKIGTVTNNQGQFQISNLSPGNYDILVQMIGYRPFSKSIVITNQSVSFEAVLTENVSQLNEVEVKAEFNRKYYLGLFKKYFIGNTANAYKCRLVNPEVLRFSFNRQNHILKVTASDYLIIDNRALGYKLKYLLNDFEFNQQTETVYFKGLPFFEELKGSAMKKEAWASARNEAYKGSYMHFFRSLYKNRVAKEGFVLNKIIDKPNTQRQPDSLINIQLKLASGLKKDSKSHREYWLAERNKAKFTAVLDRESINGDTLLHQENDYSKFISFTGKLFVIYTKDAPERYFVGSGYQFRVPQDLEQKQVSVVSMVGSEISFFENGTLEKARNALFSGYWAYKKIADILPLDYSPNN